MHTALIAIAGSALTLGVFSNINQPNMPPAPAVAAVTQSETAEMASELTANQIPTDQYAFAAGGTISLDDTTLGELFAQVRKRLDRPLVVHWDKLDNDGFGKNVKVDLETGEIPSEEALRLAILKTANDFGRIAVTLSPILIEVTTSSDLDKRTLGIRTYDIADLLANRTRPDAKSIGYNWDEAAESVMNATREIIARDTWHEFGGDLGSMQLAGGSLVVKTAERYHAQVAEFLELLRVEDQRLMKTAEARAEESRRIREEQAERQRLIWEEQTRITEAQMAKTRESEERSRKEEILRLETELERITQELATLNAQNSTSHMSSFSRQQEQTEQEREDAFREGFIRRTRMTDLSVIRQSIRDQLILLKYGVEPSTTDGISLDSIQKQLKEQSDTLRGIRNSVRN